MLVDLQRVILTSTTRNKRKDCVLFLTVTHKGPTNVRPNRSIKATLLRVCRIYTSQQVTRVSINLLWLWYGCGSGQRIRYSDLLLARRSRDRIPVVDRFSTPVQAGPGAQAAYYTMGTGSFPEVKRPGRGVDNSSPSRAEVKERVELYIHSFSGPSWPVLGWNWPLHCVSDTSCIRDKTCTYTDQNT
jgi:hypothetical protein